MQYLIQFCVWYIQKKCNFSFHFIMTMIKLSGMTNNSVSFPKQPQLHNYIFLFRVKNSSSKGLYFHSSLYVCLWVCLSVCVCVWVCVYREKTSGLNLRHRNRIMRSNLIEIVTFATGTVFSFNISLIWALLGTTGT